MKCLIYFGMSSMKEGTSAQLSGRGELHGGARVTTLVTLRKCTLGNKREIKTLKFVSASTKGFKGGLAWIKPSKKDMAVTFSYCRVPSATASHPTRSPSQPSSSWRSAAAMSVGSMRSKGPWVSPSQDRASSYTAPPALKCATASRVAPSSGGCHRTVAVACPRLRIPVARSTLAARRTMRGGTGVLTSEEPSPVHPVCGPGAACSQSPRRRVPRVVRSRPVDHGGSRPGVRPPSLERDGGVSLRRGLRGARGGAPPAPVARPLLTHYACLPRGHGAAPDYPRWEEGVL